jgi:hypothetical protein
MKRNLTILLAAAVISLPAFAAHRVTVDQLHSWLTDHKSPKNSDNDIARQISTLQLTERLTPTTLAAFKTEFAPGPKASQALDLLADCSVILDPPTSEFAVRPPPDSAAVQAMIKATFHFVGITLRQMPDFLATRVTQSYNDNDPHIAIGMPDTTVDPTIIVPHSTMIPVGKFTQQITYRDGHEVPTESKDAKQNTSEAPPGLSSRGEFGPVLSIVLLDALKGKLSWNHWEHTQSGIVAVFHYQVPQSASHFAVDYCCLGSGFDHMSGTTYTEGVFGRPPTFASNDMLSKGNLINDSYHGTPGYHGSIYVDPDTGAILRITEDAELNASEPVTRNAVSIEYGTVEIGGKKFICPVRSVALSLSRAYLKEQSGIRNILHINEAAFTNYHRFGSTLQIVATEVVH